MVPLHEREPLQCEDWVVGPLGFPHCCVTVSHPMTARAKIGIMTATGLRYDTVQMVYSE